MTPRPITLSEALRRLGYLDGLEPSIHPLEAWAALRDRGLVTGPIRVAAGRAGAWAATQETDR